MIGHQVLLSSGDSTSRVLPIEKDENKFRIRFENEFSFHPDNLAAVVDSVIHATGIASEYIVQLLTCETDEVVHSYEVGTTNDVLACRGRSQPKGCYYLQITILDSKLHEPELTSTETDQNALIEYAEPLQLIAILLLVVLVLGGVIAFLSNRNKESDTNPDVIKLGEYRFNRRTMELILGEERIELTSKECDLLHLLYEYVNDTVERDTILRMVWNDEGDYVGRTLDVFISKLRKKLEADSKIRIANIRGVGYKLIIDA
ncbi:MAG: response regulator transcription factor [Flavobacteriales bacterium]|nr:response regulator transcription factor [Flavobacteriales bacterium]